MGARMMNRITQVAWCALALIHLPPAAAAFAPELISTLYGAGSEGDAGILLQHRGALFLAVVAACLFGLLDPAARRAASAVVAISVTGFLSIYVRAGMPDGPLRTIALVDAIGLLPLAWVLMVAWLYDAA